MKTIKIESKLVLTKITIANLDAQKMSVVKGGAPAFAEATYTCCGTGCTCCCTGGQSSCSSFVTTGCCATVDCGTVGWDL
jgi:hypothetical protein